MNLQQSYEKEIARLGSNVYPQSQIMAREMIELLKDLPMEKASVEMMEHHVKITLLFSGEKLLMITRSEMLQEGNYGDVISFFIKRVLIDSRVQPLEDYLKGFKRFLEISNIKFE